MVEKRIMVSAILAVLIWALMATGTTAYYYLEQVRLNEQLSEKQKLMGMLAQNYDAFATKKNLLAGDYSNLLGEYQYYRFSLWFFGENRSQCMSKYSNLLLYLKGNYSVMLNNSPDLNKTYNNLLDEFSALDDWSAVTEEEFSSLLDNFYKVFTTLASRELDDYLGQVSGIRVSLCIDYGNQSVEWHNMTTSPGTTLFDFTRRIAKVNYSYWSTIEPGHILVDSINDYHDGYWIWYYWDSVGQKWVFGPVGSDAWMLRNNGIYNWTCVK